MPSHFFKIQYFIFLIPEAVSRFFGGDLGIIPLLTLAAAMLGESTNLVVLGGCTCGTVVVLVKLTTLLGRGLDKMLQFFLNSMVASCDTICLSIVFLEEELVPRRIFGTLEGCCSEDCDTRLFSDRLFIGVTVALAVVGLLDFSSNNGIALPLKIKLVAPVDLIMGATDDPGDNGLGLATITPVKVLDA